MTAAIQQVQSTAIQLDPGIVEKVIVKGDLSGLNESQRVVYYKQVCKDLGLNPHTQPFAMLKLNGKDLLYATRNCTDQFTALYKLTRRTVEPPTVVDIAGYKIIRCIVEVSTPDKRSVQSTGAVPVSGTAEQICNALMKAETKAGRRAVLALVGLGMLDESELDTLPVEAQKSVQQIKPIETKECVSGEFETQSTTQQTQSTPQPVVQQTAETPVKEQPKAPTYEETLFAKAQRFIEAEKQVDVSIEDMNELFNELLRETPTCLYAADLNMAIGVQRILNSLLTAESDGDVVEVVAKASQLKFAKKWAHVRANLWKNAVQAYAIASKVSEPEATAMLKAALEKRGNGPVATTATLEQAVKQWKDHLLAKKTLTEVQNSVADHYLEWSEDYRKELLHIASERLCALGYEAPDSDGFVDRAARKAIEKRNQRTALESKVQRGAQ